MVSQELKLLEGKKRELYFSALKGIELQPNYIMYDGKKLSLMLSTFISQLALQNYVFSCSRIYVKKYQGFKTGKIVFEQ